MPAQRRARAAALIAAAIVSALLGAAPAGAALAPCSATTTELCGVVPVPLDRSGQVPGAVDLAVRVLPARQGPAAGTVLFVAGGPGQAAIPLFTQEVQAFARLLPNFTFATYDQRGTGRSGELTCSALRSGSAKEYALCGARLGARRQFYRTADSVQDLEAVRQAIGAGPLSLVGVSYGGRVLGEYARAFPASVARLVLDSPTPLTGANELDALRHRAIPRVLASLCTAGACRSITRHPYGDVVRLATSLRRRSRSATYYDGNGHRHRGRVGIVSLYSVIVGSDLNPLSRSEIPGAVSSALRGDIAPLARIAVHEATSGAVAGRGQAGSGFSDTLLAATSCAESAFPWNPASAPGAGRVKLVNARVRQAGATAFSPFGSSVVLEGTAIPICVDWPAVTAPPFIAGVSTAPSLVLTGTEDLRTPSEQSRVVATGYGTARVLPIPFTGHSTIGTDVSDCALDAAASWIARGTAPTACPASHRFPRTAPRAPPSVRGLAAHRRGARGRTGTAVSLTLNDILRQVEASGTPSFRQGGLRGGRLRFSGLTIRLASYSYIPGSSLTGKIVFGSKGPVGSVRVGGASALAAAVTLLPNFKLRVRFLTGKGASAASVAGLRIARVPRPRPLPIPALARVP